MRMVLLLAAAMGLACGNASADCELTGRAPEIDTGATPAGQFYVDNDACQPTCVAGVWVYEESNGIGGLQRNDEVHDDTCGGEFAGDTLVAKVNT